MFLNLVLDILALHSSFGQLDNLLGKLEPFPIGLDQIVLGCVMELFHVLVHGIKVVYDLFVVSD